VKNNVYIIYVNSLMKEINSLTDDIYEQMTDKEYEELILTANYLITVLKDIISSHKD
tara:strand:- start:3232 stop:3402 length:171 start_codon:yes stop_codon:yes gene_type:complete